MTKSKEIIQKILTKYKELSKSGVNASTYNPNSKHHS